MQTKFIFISNAPVFCTIVRKRISLGYKPLLYYSSQKLKNLILFGGVEIEGEWRKERGGEEDVSDPKDTGRKKLYTIEM